MTIADRIKKERARGKVHCCVVSGKEIDWEKLRNDFGFDVNLIEELAGDIARHAEHLHGSGDWAARERSRLGSELDALLQGMLVTRFRRQVPESKYEEVLNRVFQRELAPWEAVKILLNGWSE